MRRIAKNIYEDTSKTLWFSKMSQYERVWVNLETKDLTEAINRTLDIRDNPLVKPLANIHSHAKRFVAYKLEKNHYSRNSASTKFHTLDAFSKWLPDTATISKVSANQINGFYDHLKKSVTDSTAQGYMMTLRSFFNWAVDIERLRIDNPVKKIEFPRVDRKSRVAWCDKRLKNSLIKHAPNDELRFVLFCGFDAGLRRGEIVEARRDWFDMKLGIIHVRKADSKRLRPGEIPFLIKDREERAIPMTKPFKKFLVGYLHGLDPLDFALYADVTHGKFRYRYDFRRPFTDYMKKMGCPWVTPHIMRHSFASILASASKSIFKISEWLGDDVRVVQRHYAKLAPGDNDIHALS